MIFLALSITCSVLIFVLFKLFERFRVANVPAIVVNYLTACLLGLLLFRSDLSSTSWESEDWLAAVALGILFISLFNIMANVTQRYSMAVASISNKMSLIFPVILALSLYGEAFSVLTILGILLALLSIALINKPKSNDANRSLPFLPIILFIGSGAIDSLFGYIARFHPSLHEGIFTSSIFGIAALIGIIYLVSQRTVPNARALLGGVTLGVINFGSIYFLLRALRQGIADTWVFPVNNVGIVLTSALLSQLLFGQRLSWINWLGVLCALTSVLMLSWNL